MRKIISKIAGLMLGLSLAAGVGVSLKTSYKEPNKVDAAQGDTVTETLDFHSSFYGMSTTQGSQTLTGPNSNTFAFGGGSGGKASASTPSSTTYAFFGKTGAYFKNTSAPSNSYISAIG